MLVVSAPSATKRLRRMLSHAVAEQHMHLVLWACFAVVHCEGCARSVVKVHRHAQCHAEAEAIGEAPAQANSQPDTVQPAVHRPKTDVDGTLQSAQVIINRQPSCDESGASIASPSVLPATFGIHDRARQAGDSAGPQASSVATYGSESTSTTGSTSPGGCASEPATARQANTANEGTCVVDVPAEGGAFSRALPEMMAAPSSSEGSITAVSVVADPQPRGGRGFVTAMAESDRVLRVHLPALAGGASDLDGASLRLESPAPAGEPAGELAEASPLCAVVASDDGGSVHPITVANSDTGDEGDCVSRVTDASPDHAHPGPAVGSSAQREGACLKCKHEAVRTPRLPPLNQLCTYVC